MSARLRTPSSYFAPATRAECSGVLQRQCAGCGNHTVAGGECKECNRNAPGIVHEVLNSPGQQLNVSTRTFMEQRFSHDFSGIPAMSKAPATAASGLTVGAHDDPSEREADQVAERIGSESRPVRDYPQTAPTRPDFSQVRVHTGPKAAESARALGARAYTVSNAVVFGEGQYAPETSAGRRLLAHELTHVMQQRATPALSAIQRTCDPATFTARTTPVFFPHQRAITRVYGGRGTINSAPRAAVRLIQQALVDLGFFVGTNGPNHDGVDGTFDAQTRQAVTNFQTAEAVVGHRPGVVDQATLKCLDEVRSHHTIPANLTGTVPEEQFQVAGEETEGRDEDIFFERGSAVLDTEDREKIQRLSVANQGCALTLNGFISEDERIDFGDRLATDRLNAVDAAFHAEHQENPGVCMPPPQPAQPAAPLRTLVPLPAASGGVITYTQRRKVEVVTPTTPSSTARCGPGVRRQRPLTRRATPASSSGPAVPAERPILTAAVAEGQTMLDTARNQLVRGNTNGDNALIRFFGSVSHRSAVRDKLRIWRNHVHSVIPRHSQRGTDCDATCANAIAYNHGLGSSAMMTLCSEFFGDITIYRTLPNAKRRAIVLVHEAGHGSLDTEDIAYDDVRLIEFIQNSPRRALQNTDSFISLIRALNGLGDPNPHPDTTQNMNATQTTRAREGLAWLLSWFIWAEQDAGNAYETINASRTSRRWTDEYYHDVANLIFRAFNIHRPGRAALPTMREQTTVAAIWDRLMLIERVLKGNLNITRDSSATPVQRWEPDAPGPSQNVFLTNVYFAITNVRGRVNMLLPLVIEGTPAIDPSLRQSYIRFIQDTVRENWSNRP